MTFFNIGLTACVVAFCAIDFLVTERTRQRALVWQWPLHLGLYLSGQLVSLVMPISAFAAATIGLSFGMPVSRWIDSWGGAPANFVIWGLAETLLVYALHYAEHRYPPLWSYHRIHHCDEDMGASTAFRHHPAEDVTSILALAVLAFVLTPTLTTLLAWYVITTLVDLFNHSRIILPERLSIALEWLIVTPRLHRVHHSPLQLQTDSNFGGTFTFWDRLFGTYRCEAPAGMGLDDPHLAGQKSRDFDTLLAEPFAFVWRWWKKV